MYVFICENNIDGIFTGIYDAWDSRLGHKNIRLTTGDCLETYELFSQYREVPLDYEKSRKVAATLKGRLGDEVYSQLCHAINAWESPKEKQKQPWKADAVYKTVVLGLSLPDGRKVLQYLGESYVNRVFALSRSTYNEAHHLTGFLRFHELKNGILFSRIHPKNQVLSFLAEHFTDRLPQESFIIYDEIHRQAAIHERGKNYLLADTPQANEAFMNDYSEKELEYQELWLGFFESITIEARKNPKLQSQNIPKRFWKDTIELSS